jgi:putative membrane protein
MTMMYGNGMGWFWVWPLLLVVGVGLLVWAVVRASATGSPRATDYPGATGNAGAPPPADRPREILRERFARGEITEEQLRAGLRVLDER